MPFVRFGLFLWVIFRAALLFARINTRFEGQPYPFRAGEARYAVARDKRDTPRRSRRSRRRAA
jgi:hypothetical protein